MTVNDLNPATCKAMYIFIKIESKKHSIEKMETELGFWLGKVPEGKMKDYFEFTKKKRKELADKCKFCREKVIK